MEPHQSNVELRVTAVTDFALLPIDTKVLVPAKLPKTGISVYYAGFT